MTLISVNFGHTWDHVLLLGLVKKQLQIKGEFFDILLDIVLLDNFIYTVIRFSPTFRQLSSIRKKFKIVLIGIFIPKQATELLSSTCQTKLRNKVPCVDAFALPPLSRESASRSLISIRQRCESRYRELPTGRIDSRSTTISNGNKNCNLYLL